MIAGLIPAAGKSLRMGRPKLVLPIGNDSVIAHVIKALRSGGADRVVVVLPPREIPGADVLAEEVRSAGADLAVLPAATNDMRASIEFGLEWLGHWLKPAAVLLAPGDSPGISARLVEQVIGHSRDCPKSIIIPTHAGRGGHPVLIPWDLARAIPALPSGVGVNHLMSERLDAVVKLEIDEPGAVADLDTPDEYERWLTKHNLKSGPS